MMTQTMKIIIRETPITITYSRYETDSEGAELAVGVVGRVSEGSKKSRNRINAVNTSLIVIFTCQQEAQWGKRGGGLKEQ